MYIFVVGLLFQKSSSYILHCGHPVFRFNKLNGYDSHSKPHFRHLHLTFLLDFLYSLNNST